MQLLSKMVKGFIERNGGCDHSQKWWMRMLVLIYNSYIHFINIFFILKVM